MANVRFICCSDTHGTVPPQAVESGCEAWLHAGDFHNMLQTKKNPSKHNHLPAMREWIKDRPIPIHAVCGNHDVADPTGLFSGINLTGNIQKLPCGINLIGIGWNGSEFYDLPRERDIAEVVSKIARQCVARIPDGEHSIVLTHYPANIPQLWRMNQDPEGWMFNSIRMLVEGMRPIAVIQGHVHELFGHQGEYNGSTILFPGPKGVYLDIDIEGPNIKSVNVSPIS